MLFGVCHSASVFHLDTVYFFNLQILLLISRKYHLILFFSYLRSFICLTSIFFFDFYFCLKTTSYLDASVQFGSVAQSCLTLCDPMNRSTPVHHQLPEFTQTHVHQPSDAIQPSHPLSSPSPPAPNPSQHQGLVQ